MFGAIVCAFVSQSAELPLVEFTTSGRGAFTIELAQKEAPQTVEHFLGLIDKKVYDGMLWHRLVAGFVLQTGDPDSKSMLPEEARSKPGDRGGTQGLGEGTWGKPIKFEPNKMSHLRGTVGLALENPGDDSGSSHFFINLADNTRLDGKYVVFGKVTNGLDIVAKIQRGDLIKSARRIR